MSLDDIREKIDALDRQIVELLNQRYGLALEVGEIKHDEHSEIYVPTREKDVLQKVSDLNDGPMLDCTVRAVYREIMSGALALEQPLRIGYLGPEATWSHQAALSRFGSSVEYVACDTLESVFAAVEKGQCDYGIVPIENTIEGPVAPTLDALAKTPLKICSELLLPISQCLLGRGEREAITEVFGHPQSLAQTRRWLQDHLPQAELLPASSTGRAAELAAESGGAAVASALAADINGLDVLADAIQDQSDNTTRFLVVGRSYGNQTGEDKTSLIIAVRHAAGSLYSALDSFRKHKLNMTKIESRPSKDEAWEYLFFLDVEGHALDESVKGALDEMAEHCTRLTVLGSYPRAVS